MKYITGLILGVLLFGSSAMAGNPQITNYSYNPGDALHPFKLLSLAIRPPIAITNVFVKGGYWVLDSDPIRRGFNIEYSPTINIDEDY
ncbi:MAG: hypothetical protein RIG61_09430 [Deltaproteobacteria bacterium]